MNNRVCITILVDNTTSKQNLLTEHGLSLWIEYGDKHILFDAGQSDILFHNAEILGVDLTRTDVIILSHGHYDHTGGLCAVLELAPRSVIYIHPGTIKPKYSCKELKVRSIGMPEAAKQAIKNHNVVWTEKPVQLCKGVTLTGQIPRRNCFEDVGGAFFVDENCHKKDSLLDDQAIFFETKQGLVVLLGCAHAGVVNTLDYVIKLTNRRNIYAIIGGMHLINANLTRIKNTIEAFKKYDIQKIMPLHCTGQEAAEKIKKTFGEKYVSSEAGAQIVF